MFFVMPLCNDVLVTWIPTAEENEVKNGHLFFVSEVIPGQI